MAKYCMAFVLLVFLALENNSIYNRLHANSQPSPLSEKESNANAARPKHTHHQHHNQNPNHPHTPHTSQYNSRQDNSIEDAAAVAALHRYMHLQRHFEHQREHQQQHRVQHEHRTRRRRHQFQEPQHHRQQNTEDSVEALAKLRTMKLVLRQLREEKEEHMYGDDPVTAAKSATYHYPSENTAQRLDSVLLPTMDISAYDVEQDERFDDGTISIGESLEEQNKNDGLESIEVDGENEDFSMQQLAESISSSRRSSPERRRMRCPKCESRQQVEHVSEEELRSLRIEFVKQQILEKLRLKERPNVTAGRLPKPIYEGTTVGHTDDKQASKELDDYYARTSKKFIFLERETRECQRLGVQRSMCFSFKIDDADADGFDVNTAVLWIFKNKQTQPKQQSNDNHSNDRKSTRQRKLMNNNTSNNKTNNSILLDQQTIVISEVQQQLDSKYLPIEKTIAIQTVDVQEEWMKIDIEWPIKRWFGNHDLSHLIHISCQSCDIESMEEMISIDKDYRPFIMIDTQNRRRPSRQKRSINCTDGVTECCREKLYISFDDIGWGDWIIQPRGYDAYFCRGACNTMASVAQASSAHSTFIQKVMSTQRANKGKALELIPCCTARQYSSLQLVFMDSNNTATQKTFPNMVVESCGCR